jgi:uncharacterized membrane protein
LIGQPNLSDGKPVRFPRLAILVLVLTCFLSLVWSHERLMWNDEFLSFYSDSVPTLHDVMEVQLHSPISLDPPTYHLLSHLMMDVFGRNAMALRLPALAGFMLMQVSLFSFVRRLAGERAGVIAMAVPLVTASFRYSVEGRPYGLLLGLYAFALLCWQQGAREKVGRRARVMALVGLTLSIVFAITSHYFGVLILVPIALGELARTIRRRRLDAGVLTAVLMGMMSVLLILPFQRALMVYRQHYYVQAVSWRNVTQGYRELFLRYATWPMVEQRIAAAVLLVAAIVLFVAGFKRYRAKGREETVEAWVALVALFLLPFFGFLFGRFVTHTMEVRYVIAALLAFAATLGIVLEERVRGDPFYYGWMAVILGVGLALNLHDIARERRDTRAVLASFRLLPDASAALEVHPEERIYVQSLNDFFLDTYYEPDATLRSRFSYVYSQEEEIRWLGHDTHAVTAVNMGRFTPLSVTSYAEFLREKSPLMVVNHGGWDWVDTDLAAKHVSMDRLGHGFRGDIVRVRALR